MFCLIFTLVSVPLFYTLSTYYTYITELPLSTANISNSPEMKQFRKELSAAVRIRDMNKASEIQSQMDEFEEKAKSSRPKRWQYEGKINYRMRTTISRGLYIFYPIFWISILFTDKGCRKSTTCRMATPSPE